MTRPGSGIQRQGRVGRFIMIPQPEYQNLFIRPVYQGIKLQVLAWVAYQTWGQRDWQHGENRRFTETPISPATVARDIGRPRESVSRALAELRADGVLIKGENGGEGIDKDRLHVLAKRDASVTPRTVMPTSHRDAHVTVNPDKTKPDRQLPTLQTRQTIQTKRKRGAARARASTPRYQEFVDLWLQMWSEHNGNKKYHWSEIDGNHLKRLLRNLGFEDLKDRVAYALAHAGEAGTALHWLRPPVSFSQVASQINACVASGDLPDRSAAPSTQRETQNDGNNNGTHGGNRYARCYST